MPDVVGFDADDACAIVRAAGLVPYGPGHMVVSTAEVMIAQRPIPAAGAERGAVVVGMAISAAVLTSWLTPLLRSRLDLSSWLRDPPAVALAAGFPVFDDLTRWTTPSWSWQLGFRWVIRVAAACFAALGLLCTAFRRRTPAD